MDTPIVLALKGSFEIETVRAIAAAQGFTVVRRSADVTELLAAASANVGRIAVVAASYLGIDREVIDRLHRSGLGVIAVSASEDMPRVGALGADAVVDVMAGPDEVVRALEIVRDGRGEEIPQEDEPEPELSDVAGKVITVWGTAGAPGRTAVAVNLAAALGLHSDVCLIDADTRAPSMTQALGIVDDISGLAMATRSANAGRLDRESLLSAARSVDSVSVLTGITRPDRWREIPSAALESVIDVCRATFPWTVIDCAGGWENEETGSFAPQREAAQVTALQEADILIIVGAADPVGIWRLVDLLSQRPRVSAEEIVVVTKVRGSVAGPGATHAVREALARFAGVGDPIIMPFDLAAYDAALLEGRFLDRTSEAWEPFDRLERRISGRHATRVRPSMSRRSLWRRK